MTLSEIERFFDRGAFERGKAYARQGRVVGLEISPDGRQIEGRVQGTEPQPYTQYIDLDDTPRGRELAGDCTCPLGMACKHLAAVLIEAATKQSRPPVGPVTALVPMRGDGNGRATPAAAFEAAAPLNYNLARWVEQLGGEQAGQATGQPIAMGAKAPRRLVFVLNPPPIWQVGPTSANDPLQLKAVGVSLKKDGTFAAKSKPFNPDSLLGSGSVASFLTEEDIGVLHELYWFRRGSVDYGVDYRVTVPPTALGMKLLQSALATGKCYLQSPMGQALALGPDQSGRLHWTADASGAQTLKVDVGSPADAASGGLGRRVKVLSTVPPLYIDETAGVIGRLELGVPLALAAQLLQAPPVEARHAAQVAVALELKLSGQPYSDMVPRPMAAQKTEVRSVRPRAILRLLKGQLRVAGYYTSGGRSGYGSPTVAAPLFRLSFDYDGAVVPASQTGGMIERLQDGQLVVMPRDTEFERLAGKRLDACGAYPIGKARLFTAPAAHAGDRFLFPQHVRSDYDLDIQMDGSRFVDFSLEVLPKLRADGWMIEIDEDYPFRVADGGGWWAEVADGSGIDWFSFALGVEFEGTRINLMPTLLKLIQQIPQAMADAPLPEATHAVDAFLAKMTLFHTLPDGRLLRLPKDRVAPILKGLMELVGPGADDAEITMTSAHQLAAFAESGIDIELEWKSKNAKRLRDLGDKLRHLDRLPSILPPPGFTGQLRPYQQAGLDWFSFLREAGFGGVLADDMGLGKTVQTLSFIASEQHHKRLNKPVLIVSPTSVLPNWEAEAARFTPNLKVLNLRGADRAGRFADIAGHDIVLTTYPLLSRDKDVLLKTEFYATFLDEAQAIKNPLSAIAKAAHELKTEHRFALTGTPLENNLSEVWSLFHYLNPGMLADQTTFKRRFRTPIEKHGDVATQRFLTRKLKPFMLRRNKDLVAKDLPPKTEVIEAIELEGPQRDLYETIRLTMHKTVREAITKKGMNKSRIMILDALLKLRQVCCDPRLLKLQAAKGVKGSAKLERVMELVTSLVAEDRRVLLFSQFTSMLALIEPELVKAKIPYVMITGDTEDRRTPVEQFQAGKVPLFLISLKAGGTGLNLTAADTVIHYDPWWNPAVELQATDRAHRLGQTKPVFVHKLIVKSTVEEGIQELCKKKAALAAALFSEDASGGDFKLTEADVDALFQVAA